MGQMLCKPWLAFPKTLQAPYAVTGSIPNNEHKLRAAVFVCTNNNNYNYNYYYYYNTTTTTTTTATTSLLLLLLAIQAHGGKQQIWKCMIVHKSKVLTRKLLVLRKRA